MKLPDENYTMINGTKYSLIRDREHEVGEGFALLIDRPKGVRERSYIPAEVLKALMYLLKCKDNDPA